MTDEQANLPKLSTRPIEPEQAVLRATGTDGGDKSGAVPGAVASGIGRLRVRMGEERDGSEGKPSHNREGNEQPLRLQGFEENRGPSKTAENGEGGKRDSRRHNMLILRYLQHKLFTGLSL